MARPFTFIDLFAGIGGFRLGMQRAGGKCVFSSEWDRFAALTYEANFGEKPFGDITKIEPRMIPDHDILVGGFPCQPFSIAGVSKSNALGRLHGFAHPTQGTLFFTIREIVRVKKPRAFILENVKNLISHDRGNTWKIIRKTLEDELGYRTYAEIIDAQAVVPQHRERLFIVGFRDGREFDFPSFPVKRKSLGEILERKVPEKYTLSPALWRYLREYKKKHQAAGNGFGYGIADPQGISRTLSARYYKDGSEILIDQGKGLRPRRLTPRECARLMGFPDDYDISRCSDTRLYRQFGNSVVVGVVERIARSVVETMNDKQAVPPLRMVG